MSICNQNCQQGRNCGCWYPEEKPVTFGLAVLIWIFTMFVCTAILWVLVNTAHAKTATYHQKVICLAETIYREARGENHRGKLAVGQTVVNRTRSGFYPQDLCEVVFQKYQFSWTHNWKGNWLADENHINLAKLVISGAHPLQNFKALYFHAHYVEPEWSKNRKKISQIGNHIFYL